MFPVWKMGSCRRQHCGMHARSVLGFECPHEQVGLMAAVFQVELATCFMGTAGGVCKVGINHDCLTTFSEPNSI